MALLWSMTLDTNILIAYLGGEQGVVRQVQIWRRERTPLFVSSITECELLSYPKLSRQEELLIEDFLLDNFTIIAFERFMARRAAAIRRQIPSLKLPDAAIAALALSTDTPLATRNIKDFQRVPSLTIVEL